MDDFSEFADWYIVQTTSPEFNGNYSDLSCFLIYADEVKANPAQWDALGLRGNQSGTLLVDNVTIPPERMVGFKGDGAASNDETVDLFFLLCSSQQEIAAMPRSAYLHWYWQIKFIASKNVAHVCDKMLHTCGGTGIKKELGIERYLRDGKAGWAWDQPTKY
ncbi:acyl-CoA dehydrogenase family protein [Gloeocapsopsis crepidinum]|uniref:acyl-CoA dehydrogenase family protein n=1 Tax=Gloeocapsopsis crepidinum TaxID=693223 RepID=UPI001D15656B|nr:acyl-CoA dehydrogenase family protein [Gloeocapsopsis crepidinum]